MPIELSNQLSELLTPFIVALLMLVIALWFKDFATKIAKGLAFSMNKSFQEGDKVILDGERALIVKIGLTQTVFGITKSNGEWDGDYVWRYVPNERIPYLKLEKVVFDNTSIINEGKIEANKSKIEDLSKK